MPAVAFNGSKTKDVDTNDINYMWWNDHHHQECNDDGCWWVGGWSSGSGGRSTIHGVVVSSSTNVFVNGKPIARQNDNVTETEDTHLTQPSAYPTSNHTGGTGKVTIGNSKNVYSGGQLVAMIGSTVKTHSTPTTTIADGSSNVFIGG